MNDAFSKLGLPASPWTDPDVAREAFQKLAASLHPDRGGDGAPFQDLVKAFDILKDPGAALRHWLEMQGTPITAGGGGMTPLVTDLFPRVGASLRELKLALESNERQPSALTRAMLKAQTINAEKLLEEIRAKRAERLERVKAVSGQEAPAIIEELRATSGELTFLDRWIAQLAEAVLGTRLRD